MIDILKRLLFLFLVCLININISYAVFPDPPKGQGIKRIVIDAGHGGKDPGCHGASEKEKHIALSIALKLGALINQNLKDVEVIYTRKTDVFVELQERANIANKNKADLFVCIHANANAKKTAYGSETYVMGLHVSKENFEVAKRENSSILLEKDHKTTYQGFDPNSVEDIIALTLIQNSYLVQSATVANNIQDNFEMAGRKNRGVKQAGFLVLRRTSMPSILIETGFLSNDAEEDFLGSEKGKNIMAKAIYQALAKYKADVEANLFPTNERKGEDPGPTMIKDAINNQVNTENVPETNKNPSPSMLDTAQKKSEIIVQDEVLETENEIKPKVSVLTIPEDIIAEEEKLITKQKTIAESQIEKKIPISEIGIVKFSVQIKTSPYQIPLKPENFKGMPGVNEYHVEGIYKYIVGNGDSADELLFLQKSARQKGYKDAFIVAFQNGERISIKKALDLLKK